MTLRHQGDWLNVWPLSICGLIFSLAGGVSVLAFCTPVRAGLAILRVYRK